MPTLPPVFMHRKRKAWEQRSSGADKRITGRAGVELRKRRLRDEPLCRMCKAEGIVRAATTPDHITPLAFGGTDTDDNIQCLCKPHHDQKSALEAARGYAASNHPDWLRPSAVPLTIVCGPPCSGKTTYVHDHAGPDDMIVDLDGIMTRLKPGYRHWSGMLDSALFNQAIRVRNEMLGQLARRSQGRAWFIISAPAKAEQDWWRDKLGGSVVVLHPGVDELKRRANDRGTPDAIAGIDRWERASRGTWAAPKPKLAKVGVDNDGWPVE